MEELMRENAASRVQHRRALNVGDGGGSGSRGRRRVGERHDPGKKQEKRVSKAEVSGKTEAALDKKQKGKEDEICDICAEVIVNFAYGPCGHVVCADCSHRMRYLYKKMDCVFCKMEMPEVVVMGSHEKDFEKARESLTLDENVGMRFESERVLKHYQRLRGSVCKSCGRPFDSVDKLKQHVRVEHKKVLCDICVAHKVAYRSELDLYSDSDGKGRKSELKQHRETHPYCKFCRKHVLDSDALFLHLQRQHESCFLCERAERLYEYYRNYENLERHYRTNHFMCENSGCRGVVFSNSIDLQVHERSHHSGGGSSSAGRTDRPRQQPIRMDISEFQSAANNRRDAEQVASDRRNFASNLVVFAGNSGPGTNSNVNEGGNRGNNRSQAGSSNGQDQTARTRNQRRELELSEQPVVPATDAGSSTASTSSSAPRTTTLDPSRLVMPTEPSNAEEERARNQLVIARLRSVLDPADFEMFRAISGEFRENSLSAENFFTEADRILGRESRAILPEITMLLRNKAQQRELSKVVRGAYRLLEPVKDTNDGRVNGDGGQPAVVSEEYSLESFPSLVPGSAPRTATAGSRRSNAPTEQFPQLGRPASSSKKSESAARKDQRSVSVPRTAAGGGSSRPARPAPADQFPMLGRAAPRSNGSNLVSRSDGEGRTSDNASSDGEHTQALRTLSIGSDLDSQRTTNAPSNPAPRPSQARPLPDMLQEELFPSLDGRRVETDPSMRVGAVWGGTARRAHQNTRKGKYVAEAPVLDNIGGASSSNSTSDFPSLVTSSSSPVSADVGVSPSGRAGTNAPSLYSGGGRVLDLGEIARQRQAQLYKSAVPKIGTNGYSWEKKKIQQKKQKAKEELAEREKRERQLARNAK